VESDTVYIGEMGGEDPEGVDVLAGPESCGAVVGGGGKIESVGSKVHVPDGVVVATVGDQVGECVCTPQPCYPSLIPMQNIMPILLYQHS
jgi:hypothetical protein